MITKTTGLDSKYSSLFEEIKEASNGAIDVQNLESFFGNIREIGALDKKFLRLPLDEPMFIIDANTRKISIDGEFSSNGLSVQGDHLAETVFFKIDRFFDFIDLYNMDFYINWKMSNGLYGRAKADFIKSKDIENGYIIFGWPVSKDVTGKSGSLSFAVQICKQNIDGEYEYNFNTLVSTIAIKDGLVLENPEIISSSDDVIAILQNSAFGEGDVAVDKAVWLTGENGEGMVPGSLSASYSAIVNLPTSIVQNDVVDGEVKLYALAGAGQDAEIVYASNSGSNSLELVGDEEERINNIRYYLENGTLAPESVVSAFFAELSSSETDKSARTSIYKKCYIIPVDTYGSYELSAQGSKTNSAGNRIGAGELSYSKNVKVPVATVPEVSLVSNIELTEEQIEEGYSIVDGVNGAVLIDGVATVTAIASGLNEDAKGAFKVKLFKNNDELSTSDWSLDLENDIEIDEAGSYSVQIVHHKNNSEVESDKSSSILVSALVDKIDSVDFFKGANKIENGIAQLSNRTGAVSIKVVPNLVESAVNAGNYSYEWYRAELENQSGEDVFTKYADGDDDNTTLKLTEEGKYKVVVTNTIGKTAFTKESDILSVYGNT